jgi:hypothetical protein
MPVFPLSLSQWKYRKKITISGSSGAGTNYQVLLKVGESSGASGANFHLEGLSAKFPSGKNDGGDLRFTASDGTTLQDFWVEQVTGTSPNRVAYVWVKVSADLGSNQSIYIYFGNSNATNASNIKNTFIVGDDFDDNSIDYSIWQDLAETGTNGTRSEVNNAYLHLLQNAGDNWKGWGLQKVFSTPIDNFEIVEIHRGYLEGTSGSKRCIVNIYDNTDNLYSQNLGKDYSNVFRGVYNPTDGNIVNEAYTAGNWVKYKTRKFGTTITFWLDDIQKWSGTSRISNLAKIYLCLLRGNSSTDTHTGDFDIIYIRKYVSPEPAFSSAGSLEKRSSIIPLII